MPRGMKIPLRIARLKICQGNSGGKRQEANKYGEGIKNSRDAETSGPRFEDATGIPRVAE